MEEGLRVDTATTTTFSLIGIIPLNCPYQRDIIRIKDIYTYLREGI